MKKKDILISIIQIISSLIICVWVLKIFVGFLISFVFLPNQPAEIELPKVKNAIFNIYIKYKVDDIEYIYKDKIKGYYSSFNTWIYESPAQRLSSLTSYSQQEFFLSGQYYSGVNLYDIDGKYGLLYFKPPIKYFMGEEDGDYSEPQFKIHNYEDKISRDIALYQLDDYGVEILEYKISQPIKNKFPDNYETYQVEERSKAIINQIRDVVKKDEIHR